MKGGVREHGRGCRGRVGEREERRRGEESEREGRGKREEGEEIENWELKNENKKNVSV